MGDPAESQVALRGFAADASAADESEAAGLSSKQAREVAYRFLARYYDYERIAPILRLLQTVSWSRERPSAEAWAVSELWEVSLEETLADAPLPELPPPWES